MYKIHRYNIDESFIDITFVQSLFYSSMIGAGSGVTINNNLKIWDKIQGVQNIHINTFNKLLDVCLSVCLSVLPISNF